MDKSKSTDTKTRQFVIRTLRSDDRASILELYPSAFAEEDLSPLVRKLLDLCDNEQHDDNKASTILALVAVDNENDKNVVGSIFFTICTVKNKANSTVALLGPLAVHPTRQKQGIESPFIQKGKWQLADKVECILVLGDPNYYGRFDFAQECSIQPPYPLPKEWASAWQSLDPKRASSERMRDSPISKEQMRGIGC